MSSAGDATGEAGDDLQQIPTLELPSKKSTASNSSSSKPEAVDTYGDLNKASDVSFNFVDIDNINWVNVSYDFRSIC